jgi:hypothetical protein
MLSIPTPDRIASALGGTRRAMIAAVLVTGLALNLGAGALAVIRMTANPVALPLGDGDWSTTGAKVGYVYSCTAVGGGGGASSPGPWIDQTTGTWNSLAKIAVQGSNAYSGVYTAKANANKQVRLLSGNGLPKQPAGTFPIQPTDPAYAYDRNPNTIAATSFRWSVPLNPSVATRPSCLPMGAIGVLNDGVALFNALDGEGRDAAAWEILDARGGHPERTGQYHHHNVPAWMAASTGTAHSSLVGYAKDGFGIYGPLGNGGAVLSNGNLDACHGHTHKVRWNGKQQKVYHYHATAEFPYTLGCFKGTPVR